MGWLTDLAGLAKELAPIATGWLQSKEQRKYMLQLEKLRVQAPPPIYYGGYPQTAPATVAPPTAGYLPMPGGMLGAQFPQAPFVAPTPGGYVQAPAPPYVQPVGTTIQLPSFGPLSLGTVTTDGAVVPRTGTPLINAPGLFRTAPTGARAVSSFVTPNPATGNLTWYKNMGRPVLFSGDLAAAKRVRRVAARARRSSYSYRRTTSTTTARRAR